MPVRLRPSLDAVPAPAPERKMIEVMRAALLGVGSPGSFAALGAAASTLPSAALSALLSVLSFSSRFSQSWSCSNGSIILSHTPELISLSAHSLVPHVLPCLLSSVSVSFVIAAADDADDATDAAIIFRSNSMNSIV